MTTPIHINTGARALGALPSEEAREFDDHMTDCDTCPAEYGEFLETAALLGSAVAEVPPQTLRVSVLDAIAITPQLPPEVSREVLPGAPDEPHGDQPPDQDPAGQPDSRPGATAGEGSVTPLERRGRHRTAPPGYPRQRPWWRRGSLQVAAAAVIVLLVAASIIFASWPSSLSPQQEAAQCVHHAADATVEHPDVGHGGSVTVAPSCSAAVVEVAHMPAPPTGKAYQLWVIAGKQARSAGMVAHEVNSSGHIVVTDLTDSDTDVGISVEPEGGSKQPTSTPIWVAPLSS